MKVDITTYGGISTATVNGFASVSNYWPLALAGATLKYWRSIIAKRFHLCLFLFALLSSLFASRPSSAQELTIAYSRAGIDTVFIERDAKIDTMYSMRPSTWLSPIIAGKAREHFYSAAHVDNLKDRIDTLESGWKNGMLYLELTKAHDLKVDSLRKYISHLESRISKSLNTEN